MNENSKNENMLSVARSQIENLQKKFPVSYKKIEIVLDNDAPKERGSGCFQPKHPNTIILMPNYFNENEENFIEYIKKSTSHEFCHLYINDKGYLENGRFNKDIEKEILRLINNYNIDLKKKDNGKIDISSLITSYADKNANINIWHEVLCEAFSLYITYDYVKNERNLIPEAYNFHKDLVTFLTTYTFDKNGCSYIDELDIDYYMHKN